MFELDISSLDISAKDWTPPVHVTHPRRSRPNILSFQLKLNLCLNVLFITWAELAVAILLLLQNSTLKSDFKVAVLL